MNLLLDLFLTLAKVGMFTFGGGYAMISIIEDTCVEKKKWLTHDEMMDITVIAESTPGPIAINAATYVGYKQAGIPGSIAATVGMVLPSFVIIYLISCFMDNLLEITLVADAFRGIRLAVGLVILRAGINMLRIMKKPPFSVTVAAVSGVILLLSMLLNWNLSSVMLMLAGGCIALSLHLVKGGLGK